MDVSITLLGGFSVSCPRDDVPTEAWNRRGAAALVKLLALTDGLRMHREQVMDALWPELSVDEAGPRLHKAAHYARRALGETTAVQLRHDLVQLLPDAEVSVDAVDFRRGAEAALAAGSVPDAQAALEGYGGALLPPIQVQFSVEGFPTTSTSRGPPSGGRRCPCCTRTCSGSPPGGRSCSGTHPRTRRRTSR